MFERFTSEARQVVVVAQEEARALGHDYVGTEHLLLGALAQVPSGHRSAVLNGWLTLEQARADVVELIGRGDPVLDADALALLGIDLEDVRRRVEATFGDGALTRPRRCRRGRIRGIRCFTRRAKKALELSLREALAAGDTEIRPEHVLLGLLREGEGIAARILAAHGVRLDDVRAAFRRDAAA
jgi:ATP-dependent Clp protease ATP-binding subunit ClpA